jgi:hypothetical protein
VLRAPALLSFFLRCSEDQPDRPLDGTLACMRSRKKRVYACTLPDNPSFKRCSGTDSGREPPRTSRLAAHPSIPRASHVTSDAPTTAAICTLHASLPRLHRAPFARAHHVLSALLRAAGASSRAIASSRRHRVITRAMRTRLRGARAASATAATTVPFKASRVRAPHGARRR